MIIPIDASTISENPHRSGDLVLLEGRKTIRLYSDSPLPPHFNGFAHLVYSVDFPPQYEYVLSRPLDESIGKSLIELGFMIEYEHNPRQISLGSQPKYHFDYVNVLIPCSKCGVHIHFNQIEHECNDDGCWEECPICHEADSFKYELEKVEDALYRVLGKIPISESF